jgi:hypothetical protein
MATSYCEAAIPILIPLLINVAVAVNALENKRHRLKEASGDND